MNEFFSSFRATLAFFNWQDISLVVGPLVGFASAWLLFEVTERRRVRLTQRELRQALIVELEHVEVLVSSIVGKYAHRAQKPAEVALVANEIRWFVNVGRERMADVGVLSDLPPTPADFAHLDDATLVAVFAQVAAQETVGNKIILPVVEAALGGRTSGFNARQIQALSTIRWQAYLLDQDAEWMGEFLRLTFTVTDEGNHALVVANHEQRTDSYARRARTLLRSIRAGLALMRDSR